MTVIVGIIILGIIALPIIVPIVMSFESTETPGERKMREWIGND